MDSGALPPRTAVEIQAALANLDALVACGVLTRADAEPEHAALRVEGLALVRAPPARAAGGGAVAGNATISAGAPSAEKPGYTSILQPVDAGVGALIRQLYLST